ncbi:MAG: hypothetical protein ACR2JY_06765 [Chloroflexota bacterium]
MPQIQREASGQVMRGSPRATPVARRPGHISRFRMLFHFRKTVQLVQAVLADRRVPVLRKALFVWALVMLAVALLIPDAGSALASMFLPVLGPLLDLPADAALDWSVAIALAPWLLRLLPTEVVAEHQAAIFG